MSTTALRLPNSFVDIDREEMQYIDGGGGNIIFIIDKSVIVAAATIGATAAAGACLSVAGITGGASVYAVPALAVLITTVGGNGFRKQSSYTLPLYISNQGYYFLLLAASGFDGKITLEL